MGRCLSFAFAMVSVVCLADAGTDGLVTERFDLDPRWDGLNHRPASPPRIIEQNFDYSKEEGGRIGGLITPAGEAAYYAKPLAALDLNTPFSAGGKLRMEPGGGNLLLGFFNAETVNEWRTPNSLVFRFNGRGDTYHAHIEYATSKWRAGAGVIGRYDKVADRMHPVELPSGRVSTWSLVYDPSGHDGSGTIRATLDDYEATCDLAPGHKDEGATLNRFGLLNVVKSADGAGTVWVTDLVINGEAQDLMQDPGWEKLRNRVTYPSEEVRARFNFGFSPTNFAGGERAGEMGGLFYRGDCRYAERLAYYGAHLDGLTLAKPIRASGRVAFLRGVSDSTTLFGFFHSRRSVHVNPSQSHGTPEYFLGFAIEGPSAEGFLVYPVYRFEGDVEFAGIAAGAPRIFPDGVSHTFALAYLPSAAGGAGKLALALDAKTVELDVPAEHVAAGAEFDRFGLVTPWIDGNGQVVYFDDLTYSVRQP